MKKYAVIGGTSGIGKAVVEKLIGLGHKVIVIGNNKDSIEKLRSEEIQALLCDTSNSLAVESLILDIKSKFGELDGMVNCAGQSKNQNRGEYEPELFKYLIDNNLLNAYNVTHLFGYNLISSGGSIVNVSSIRGRTGTDSNSSGYAAAKAGVVNLTKTYAIELAAKNIRVNCIAPGLTYPTGLSKDWTQEFRDKISNTIPLHRLASPSEIAGPIVFLLSDDASYITGQTLDVNGGLWMN